MGFIDGFHGQVSWESMGTYPVDTQTWAGKSPTQIDEGITHRIHCAGVYIYIYYMGKL